MIRAIPFRSGREFFWDAEAAGRSGGRDAASLGRLAGIIRPNPDQPRPRITPIAWPAATPPRKPSGAEGLGAGACVHRPHPRALPVRML